MPTYEVIYDLAVPSDEPADDGKRFKPSIIEGGVGNTVEMDEGDAGSLVALGILAVPGAREPARHTRRLVIEARQSAEEARQSAAVAEDEAQSVEARVREEAASRVRERSAR